MTLLRMSDDQFWIWFWVGKIPIFYIFRLFNLIKEEHTNTFSLASSIVFAIEISNTGLIYTGFISERHFALLQRNGFMPLTQPIWEWPLIEHCPLQNIWKEQQDDLLYKLKMRASSPHTVYLRTVPCMLSSRILFPWTGHPHHVGAQLNTPTARLPSRQVQPTIGPRRQC